MRSLNQKHITNSVWPNRTISFNRQRIDCKQHKANQSAAALPSTNAPTQIAPNTENRNEQDQEHDTMCRRQIQSLANPRNTNANNGGKLSNRKLSHICETVGTAAKFTDEASSRQSAPALDAYRNCNTNVHASEREPTHHSARFAASRVPAWRNSCAAGGLCAAACFNDH